eukprot:scaffold301_cov150-Amphora_coffeaeformis.AAC.3
MEDHFVVSYNARIRQKRPHTVLSSGFMHASISHLLSNMAALTAYGDVLLRVLGPRKMAYFYMIALQLSDLFDIHVYQKCKKWIREAVDEDLTSTQSSSRQRQPKEPQGSVGASGAIYALVSYVLLEFPHLKVQVADREFAGLDAAVALVAMEAFPEHFLPESSSSTDLVIGHGAHIGGLLYGNDSEEGRVDKGRDTSKGHAVPSSSPGWCPETRHRVFTEPTFI